MGHYRRDPTACFEQSENKQDEVQRLTCLLFKSLYKKKLYLCCTNLARLPETAFYSTSCLF